MSTKARKTKQESAALWLDNSPNVSKKICKISSEFTDEDRKILSAILIKYRQQNGDIIYKLRYSSNLFPIEQQSKASIFWKKHSLVLNDIASVRSEKEYLYKKLKEARKNITSLSDSLLWALNYHRPSYRIDKKIDRNNVEYHILRD